MCLHGEVVLRVRIMAFLGLLKCSVTFALTCLGRQSATWIHSVPLCLCISLSLSFSFSPPRFHSLCHPTPCISAPGSSVEGGIYPTHLPTSILGSSVSWPPFTLQNLLPGLVSLGSEAPLSQLLCLASFPLSLSGPVTPWHSQLLTQPLSHGLGLWEVLHWPRPGRFRQML